jgi:hypothetical protein
MFQCAIEMFVGIFRVGSGMIENAVSMIQLGIGGNASNSANLMFDYSPLMVNNFLTHNTSTN